MAEHKFANITWHFGKPPKPADPLNDTFRQLDEADSLRQQGQLDRAQAICESLLANYPDYFGALFTLGLIFIERRQFPQALGVLVRAVMLNPRSWRALTALSAVYLELEANEMAAATLEQAIAIQPDDPNVLVTLGTIYSEEREYELARKAFRRAYELDSGLIEAAVGLGTCCSHLGEYREAAEVFESLLKRDIRPLGILHELTLIPPSYLSVDLADELSRVTRDDEEQSEFENSLAFVRAATLDRAGRHEEAWRTVAPANRQLFEALQSELRQQEEVEAANLAQLGKRKSIEVCRESPEGPQTISLFILGPSRSGKTTLESLIGRLNGVKLGYENPIVENAVRRTFQSAGLLTTKLFEILPEKLNPQCREIYLDELSRRAGSARVFTNTHPGRIHDAARIAASFPNARFVFVKRNIEDSALRIFMRKYQTSNYYAYDLNSIYRHLKWYHDMIDQLAAKLSDISRVVRYEEMVDDPARAVETVADLCGLIASGEPLPQIGDDRGCANPYRQLMQSVG